MAPGGMRGSGRGGRGKGMGRGRRFGRGMGAGRGMGRGMGTGPGMGSDPGGSIEPGPGQVFGYPAQPQGPPSLGTPEQSEVERLKELARSIEQQKEEIEQQISQAKSGKVAGPVKLKAVVDESLCTGCGVCLDVCPVDAIVLLNDVATVSDDCTACGACVAECPNNALAMGPA